MSEPTTLDAIALMNEGKQAFTADRATATSCIRDVCVMLDAAGMEAHPLHDTALCMVHLPGEASISLYPFAPPDEPLQVILGAIDCRERQRRWSVEPSRDTVLRAIGWIREALRIEREEHAASVAAVEAVQSKMMDELAASEEQRILDKLTNTEQT